VFKLNQSSSRKPRENNYSFDSPAKNETDSLYADFNSRMRQQQQEALFQSGEKVDIDDRLERMMDKNGLNAYLSKSRDDGDREKERENKHIQEALADKVRFRRMVN
jgi:hypothetical protein